MKQYDYVVVNKRKGKVKIKLEPGRKYYFQICGVVDADYDFDDWRGKTSVSVRK